MNFIQYVWHSIIYQIVSNTGEKVGTIWKKWPGFNDEHNMDHEYFGLDGELYIRKPDLRFPKKCFPNVCGATCAHQHTPMDLDDRFGFFFFCTIEKSKLN